MHNHTIHICNTCDISLGAFPSLLSHLPCDGVLHLPDMLGLLLFLPGLLVDDLDLLPPLSGGDVLLDSPDGGEGAIRPLLLLKLELFMPLVGGDVGDVLGDIGGVLLGLHLDLLESIPKDFLPSSFLLKLGDVLGVVAVVDDDCDDNGDLPDILLVISDLDVNFNLCSFVPEDDGDVLVRSLSGAEDD